MKQIFNLFNFNKLGLHWNVIVRSPTTIFKTNLKNLTFFITNFQSFIYIVQYYCMFAFPEAENVGGCLLVFASATFLPEIIFSFLENLKTCHHFFATSTCISSSNVLCYCYYFCFRDLFNEIISAVQCFFWLFLTMLDKKGIWSCDISFCPEVMSLDVVETSGLGKTWSLTTECQFVQSVFSKLRS